MLLLLVLVVGVESASMGVWIRKNGAPVLPVCCDLVQHVFDLERMDAADHRMDPAQRWRPSMGLAPLLAHTVGDLLPGNEDFTLYTGLLAMVLAQILLFETGRRLSGPTAGLVAAALLPLLPVVAFLERRWDVYLLELPVVILGVLMAIVSDGFKRVPPTAGFALALFLGAIMSPRPTDSLLVVATLVSVGLATGLRTLLQARGFTGQPVSRGRGLLGIAISATAVVLLYGFRFHHDNIMVGYYGGEMSSMAYQGLWSRWHWRQLTAYPAHLFWRGLTPWMALPFEIGLVVWLWRGRGRLEVGTWLGALTLVLSLISKKNFYYLAPVYPALPLVIGLGIASAPWRSLRIMLALAVLGVAGFQYATRAHPEAARWIPTGSFRWDAGDRNFGVCSRPPTRISPWRPFAMPVPMPRRFPSGSSPVWTVVPVPSPWPSWTWSPPRR